MSSDDSRSGYIYVISTERLSKFNLYMIGGTQDLKMTLRMINLDACAEDYRYYKIWSVTDYSGLVVRIWRSLAYFGPNVTTNTYHIDFEYLVSVVNEFIAHRTHSNLTADNILDDYMTRDRVTRKRLAQPEPLNLCI